MARPRIGVFGILMVVGGMLALRWAQKHGGAQLPLGRELNRWENEGGNVVTPSAVVPKTGVAPRVSPMAPITRTALGRGRFRIVDTSCKIEYRAERTRGKPACPFLRLPHVRFVVALRLHGAQQVRADPHIGRSSLLRYVRIISEYTTIGAVSGVFAAR